MTCHHTPVTTVGELQYRVEAVWSSVPVHAIQSLFDSMPRRYSPVITTRGFGNNSKKMEMSVNATIQIAPELQCRMKTDVLQKLQKEAERVEHLTCLVSYLQPQGCHEHRICVYGSQRPASPSKLCTQMSST
ncbi:hypothetical protein TNCV_4447191 [Trichonephila clavipes]|nr:hypothetical protein TNCV_4447191 [Trichonephila clavipes]